jgi:hypothetical protein
MLLVHENGASDNGTKDEVARTCKALMYLFSVRLKMVSFKSRLNLVLFAFNIASTLNKSCSQFEERYELHNEYYTPLVLQCAMKVDYIYDIKRSLFPKLDLSIENEAVIEKPKQANKKTNSNTTNNKQDRTTQNTTQNKTQNKTQNQDEERPDSLEYLFTIPEKRKEDEYHSYETLLKSQMPPKLIHCNAINTCKEKIKYNINKLDPRSWSEDI